MTHAGEKNLSFRGDRYEEVPPDDWTTLGQLQQWYQLAARCGGCGRISRVDRYAIARAHGSALPLCAIGARLTCQVCRNKAGNVLLLGTMPRD
ncbi:hypothetical protein G8E10_17830 [Rhizobiaceae bacterium CRRU44]|uniref:Uncharacterized protein n=1 Tax=Ferranicluibacter rubi TaxID=2715133 RepID=A0AA43ZGQ6_9HYPH|nr:hypothetical protein [Ferranicluibacter rubi]NHT77577.1 hypothetical protein [Ferranicluibacter rubi]